MNVVWCYCGPQSSTKRNLYIYAAIRAVVFTFHLVVVWDLSEWRNGNVCINMKLKQLVLSYTLLWLANFFFATDYLFKQLHSFIKEKKKPIHTEASLKHHQAQTYEYFRLCLIMFPRHHRHLVARLNVYIMIRGWIRLTKVVSGYCKSSKLTRNIFRTKNFLEKSRRCYTRR